MQECWALENEAKDKRDNKLKLDRHPDKRGVIKNYFRYFSTKTYVVGT